MSRINKQGKIQFVAIVIDDYKGVRDCFGFNEISKFECNTIIERFYRGQRALDLQPGVLKSILIEAEKLSKHKIPYEYLCWKNLLADIELQPLKLDYKIKKLTNDEFEDILKYDFTDYWFLNSSYSDEFEDFIKILEETKPQDYEKSLMKTLKKFFIKKNIRYGRKEYCTLLY